MCPVVGGESSYPSSRAKTTKQPDIRPTKGDSSRREETGLFHQREVIRVWGDTLEEEEREEREQRPKTTIAEQLMKDVCMT